MFADRFGAIPAFYWLAFPFYPAGALSADYWLAPPDNAGPNLFPRPNQINLLRSLSIARRIFLNLSGRNNAALFFCDWYRANIHENTTLPARA